MPGLELGARTEQRGRGNAGHPTHGGGAHRCPSRATFASVRCSRVRRAG